jgi:hypothetical protein
VLPLQVPPEKVLIVVEFAHVADGGLVHSAELQQPDEGMQTSPQALYVLLHSQAYEMQLAFDWQSPVVQHPSTSIQVPLQSLVPSLHTHWLLVHILSSSHSSVTQQPLSGMHLSSHLLKPLLQTKSQLPLQIASAFEGTGQLTQSGPQAVGSSSSMHSPLHS